VSAAAPRPRAPPSPSLGGTLSLWLGLQGLVGALAVAAAVVAVNAWTLEARQADLLQVKSAIVRQELARPAPAGAAHDLQQHLAAFLAGHEAMSLSVRTVAGDLLFDSITAAAASSNARPVRTIAWRDRWPGAGGQPVDVVLGLDIGADIALLQRVAWIVIAASVAAAMLSSLTGYALVRRGLRPIRALSAALDEMTPSQPGARLPDRGQPAELVPLIQHFNALLARTEEAYRQLESFNADVAHELRTPLTTLIGSSEVALRRSRSLDELRDVIAGNLEDLRRLAFVVKDMLFLSRADRGARARRTPVPSLAAALSDIVQFHEPGLDERQVALVVEGDARGDFDVALLQRAVANLLGNASRHALPGTTVRVCIEPTTDRVRLSVVNRGAPIDEACLPRLFTRFYRDDPARERADAAHHGLGLAIVAAIARMHGGTAFARSRDGHNAFGIELPTSEHVASAAAVGTRR
jgi:two-component system, OmpR family, heavy metal sensor histidine kinase CusS